LSSWPGQRRGSFSRGVAGVDLSFPSRRARSLSLWAASKFGFFLFYFHRLSLFFSPSGTPWSVPHFFFLQTDSVFFFVAVLETDVSFFSFLCTAKLRVGLFFLSPFPGRDVLRRPCFSPPVRYRPRPALLSCWPAAVLLLFPFQVRGVISPLAPFFLFSGLFEINASPFFFACSGKALCVFSFGSSLGRSRRHAFLSDATGTFFFRALLARGSGWLPFFLRIVGMYLHALLLPSFSKTPGCGPWPVFFFETIPIFISSFFFSLSFPDTRKQPPFQNPAFFCFPSF